MGAAELTTESHSPIPTSLVFPVLPTGWSCPRCPCSLSPQCCSVESTRGGGPGFYRFHSGLLGRGRCLLLSLREVPLEPGSKSGETSMPDQLDITTRA